MKIISLKSSAKKIILCSICLLCLTSCGDATKRKINTATLDLDIGIGFSHFENDSDYPEPSDKAYLDVYSSKIIIRDAYEDKVIETPLLYNNSSTAYPRKELTICGNRMYVVYCPDISVPSLQIASTDDGGNSWIQSTLSLDTNEIGSIDRFTPSFWSTKSGAIVIASGMVDTYIYFTNDAGKTWTRSSGAPPSQNWHDSLYKGAFLSENIGIVSYVFYSYPPNEPQVYLTLDQSETWNQLKIKVPDSVMESYALAGRAFYDGSKINIPIELYDTDDQLVNTVYYVSYDLGNTWKFFADEEEALEQIRADELQRWFAENRPAELADREFTHSEFSLYSTINVSEDVHIDAYKLVTLYSIDNFSSLKLTGNMYFDKNANLYYKGSDGWPILFFIYKGDVFSHTYSLIDSCLEKAYKNEGETNIGKRLYDELLAHEELETLFAEGSEAYALFTGYAEGMEIMSTAEFDGVKYDEIRIKDTVSTKKALGEYVSTFFSSEIADTLMNTTVDGHPLYIEQDGKLYRYSGYSSMASHNDLETVLKIKNHNEKSAVITISADTTFNEKKIDFNYDLECYRDTDGKMKFKTYTLPIIRAMQIINGTDEDSVDMTESEINNINDWSKLSYTSAGGEQIRQFLKAFIEGNSAQLAQYSTASEIAVFSEYANIPISSYKIEKKYIGGQSLIAFTYTIDKAIPGKSVSRTDIGTHTLYVKVNKNSVYFESPDEKKMTDLEKYLSDFFSATLDWGVPDFSNLNFQQTENITDFIVHRLGGASVSKSAIQTYTYSVFLVSGFEPSKSLMNNDGTYSSLSRGTRALYFEVESRNEFGGDINISVRFFADQSKLVAARTVDYTISSDSVDYKIISAYTSQVSDYKILKVS